MPTESFEISEAADAVPVARRNTRTAVDNFGCDQLADSAELVVSELVTNAVLHAGFPIRVTLTGEDDGVRIEVHDCSRDIPVQPQLRAQGMTGRGLTLVDAVASRWGADPTANGKVVWADVRTGSSTSELPGDASIDAVLGLFEDAEPEPGPPRFTVTLGDVPTDLLIEAKAHVDSVIRELTLSAAGAASGMSALLPPHLAELVHNVVNEFSSARQAIKRQAMTAAAQGLPRTTLTLTLPASAATAGERYLTALEDADSFARASRLLTIAAPPQHRAFRRWYVTSLVAALREAAAGRPQTPAVSFEAYLLAQVDELAALRDVSDRAARLQRVTASLAAELSAERAADVALEDAMAELGAARGCVLLISQGGMRSAADRNFSPDQYARLNAAWRAGTDLPVVTVARGGASIWLESREECATQFPQLAAIEADVAAMCVVPMLVADHVVGLLRLSFVESRLFTYDERAFLTALGAVTAQSFERAALYDSQGRVADQLTRLQQVAAALSEVQSLDDVLDVIVAHATGLVGAQVASISLVEPGETAVRLVRIEPALPAGSPWTATYDIADDLPAAAAIRTGSYLHIASVSERNERWPAMATLDWGFEHALVVLPMHADNSTVGALTLSFAVGTDADESAREFLTAFADAGAQAVQRARSADRADAANRKLAFLARASEELAASLDIDRTLANVARLAVPDVADWCVVHLLRDGELTTVAVEHIDAAKRELALEVQRRWPERLADMSAVSRVVRSGESFRVADIPSFATSAMPVVRDPEHVAILEQLGLQSVIIVPLRGRARTLGAMTFVAAESSRHYGPADQAFVEDLARRAGIAIENATLFQESTVSAARGLERALGAVGTSDDAASGADPVLAAAAIGRFEMDVAAGTVDADEIVAELFSLTSADDRTRFDTYITRIHPDDAPRVLAAIADAVEQRTAYSIEYRVTPPDGGMRWIMARGRALESATGEGTTLAGVIYESTNLRDRRDELARLLETMTDAFYRLDREWRFTYINTQAERLLMRRRTELLGRTLWDAYPDVVGTEAETEFRAAQRSGAQATFELYFAPLLSWYEVRATPDAEGLSVFFHDVTSRKNAEEARVQAHDRLALLGEAARGLVGTLDVTTVMHQVASVVVPRLGDWAVLTMVDASGEPQANHGLHYDAVVAAEMARVAELASEFVPGSRTLADVLRSGNPFVRSNVDIRAVTSRLPGGELAALLETLGFASLMVVPLQSGASTVGLLALVNGPARAPFDDQDVATAVDIGRRAGLAIDNAQLYARQRNASEVLQRSLLTPLPEPELLHVVARYRPAGQEAQIGGDWYDSFLQPDGATVLAIGDVVGHDMNAAAAMGQLRNLLRGVAFDRQDPPASVLARVDTAIRGLRIDTLATAVVGRLEQSPEQRARFERTFRWSNAGHPPPMLMRADGTVEVLEGAADLLLGFDPEAQRHDHTVVVRAGDTLLLYTDGLVERRDSPIEEGLSRLQKAFAELVGVDLDELCDRLVQVLLPENADDDVALVAVRAFGEDRPRLMEARPRHIPPDVPEPAGGAR